MFTLRVQSFSDPPSSDYELNQSSNIKAVFLWTNIEKLAQRHLSLKGQCARRYNKFLKSFLFNFYLEIIIHKIGKYINYSNFETIIVLKLEES
jgi:hypothetical protein